MYQILSHLPTPFLIIMLIVMAVALFLSIEMIRENKNRKK